MAKLLLLWTKSYQCVMDPQTHTGAEMVGSTDGYRSFTWQAHTRSGPVTKGSSTNYDNIFIWRINYFMYICANWVRPSTEFMEIRYNIHQVTCRKPVWYMKCDESLSTANHHHARLFLLFAYYRVCRQKQGSCRRREMSVYLAWITDRPRDIVCGLLKAHSAIL